jgi:hypothetical protein
MALITDGMIWFKQTFQDQVTAGIESTPFTLDFLTAIAVQETFEIWGNLFKKLPVDQVLQLCVGDTLDAPNRHAFPVNKADLLSFERGQEVFDAARAALEAMGEQIAVYGKIAATHPEKFCHGFGIFQFDIQFCKADPDYFIGQQWGDFDNSLGKCLTELKAAQARAGLGDQTELSDEELAHVAIAYNCGRFIPARGLKQGFQDASGKFYGEMIAQYISMAAGVEPAEATVS